MDAKSIWSITAEIYIFFKSNNTCGHSSAATTLLSYANIAVTLAKDQNLCPKSQPNALKLFLMNRFSFVCSSLQKKKKKNG